MNTYSDCLEEFDHISGPQYNPYGKYKVILSNNFVTLTIGPDYWFFIGGMSFFILTGLTIVSIVFQTSQNSLFRLATFIIFIVQILTYLNVAFSNPGIVSNQLSHCPVNDKSISKSVQLPNSLTMKKKSSKQRFCKKCNIYVKPTTLHCDVCEICIQQFDHHCPWVTKCIGKNNKTKFYIFLSWTPFFIIYCFISFFVCATFQLASTENN